MVMLSTAAHAQLPTPSKGWNLGNTLEPPSGPGSWGPLPTKALIDSVKAQGFNTVRVPCAWMSNADRNGNINPTYMAQVKQVVDWCIADGLYVIINEHWDGGWFENDKFSRYSSTINSKLQKLWTQVGNSFASYDTHLLFACANEPNASSLSQTNILFQYYRNWVPTIRGLGGNNPTRWLLIQGPNTNINATCSQVTSAIWPNDPAKHLMIEVHEYEPFQFVGLTSDATWGNMFYFWGAPYHTAGLASRNATWGEESYISSQMAQMKTTFVNAGIPVLIGEWRASPKPTEPDLTGQYITQNYNSTTYWNYYVANAAISNGLYSTCWDIPGLVFDWTTGAVKDQTTINALLGKSYVPPISGL